MCPACLRDAYKNVLLTDVTFSYFDKYSCEDRWIKMNDSIGMRVHAIETLCPNGDVDLLFVQIYSPELEGQLLPDFDNMINSVRWAG